MYIVDIRTLLIQNYTFNAVYVILLIYILAR